MRNAVTSADIVIVVQGDAFSNEHWVNPCKTIGSLCFFLHFKYLPPPLVVDPPCRWRISAIFDTPPVNDVFALSTTRGEVSFHSITSFYDISQPSLIHLHLLSTPPCPCTMFWIKPGIIIDGPLLLPMPSFHSSNPATGLTQRSSTFANDLWWSQNVQVYIVDWHDFPKVGLSQKSFYLECRIVLRLIFEKQFCRKMTKCINLTTKLPKCLPD